MAWIESHQELARHPKTLRLARLLDSSVPTVIGHLHLFWWWALDYAEDGDLSKYEPADLNDAVRWNGETDLFRSAMLEARFLDQDESGSISIHDWETYVGRLLDQRRHRAERTQRNRQLYADDGLTRAVRFRDGSHCRYCHKEVNWTDRKGSSGGTYDHVEPDAGNTVENIVVACRGCNSGKGRRTPVEAGMVLLPPFGDISALHLPESTNGLPTVPDLTVPNQTEPEKKNRVPTLTDESRSRLSERFVPFFGLEGFEERVEEALTHRAALKWRGERGIEAGVRNWLRKDSDKMSPPLEAPQRRPSGFGGG